MEVRNNEMADTSGISPKKFHEPKTEVREVVRQTLDKAYLFARVFNTADGQEVLKHLSEEFNPASIFDGSNNNKTNYNLGKRDAFVYIEQILRFAKTHGENK